MPAGKVRAAVAWTPAVICALWAFARMLDLEPGFPAVPLMAYTPYVLPLSVLALVVALVLKRWVAAVVALYAVAAFALMLAPRVLGDEKTAPGSTTVGLMSANVLRGEADATRLLELADEGRVEILALQEVTPEFVERFEAAGGGEAYPHSAVAAEPGVIGSAIYSVHPVRKTGTGDLPFRQMRAIVNAGRERGGVYDVTSVHPVPPTGPRAVDKWEQGLEVLPGADEEHLQLLLGDFNSTLDNAGFRDVLGSGYDDLAEKAGEGLDATWPALGDRSFRYLPVTIDHLLVEDGVETGRYEVLDIDGTDHRPVYGQLEFGGSSSSD